MKKKLIAIIPVFILMMTMCMMTAFAADAPRLVDDADLLSDSQEDALIKKLDDLSEKLEMDVVVYTKPDLGPYVNSQSYADDLYDEFGYNSTNGGVLLLISMEERDWAVSTYAKAHKILNDKRLGKLVDSFTPALKSGDYNKAFNDFADGFEKQVKASKFVSPIFLLISPAVGLLVGFIYAGHLKSQLDSVKMAANANDYIREGSFNLTGQRDTFLYNDIKRTHIERSSGGGGSGGSHVSSSGRTHGGASGKF